MNRRAVAYRLLVSFSAVTFLVAGLTLSAPHLVWGPLGQIIVVAAGVALLASIVIESRPIRYVAAYLSGVAGLLLTATAILLDYPERWSAVFVWFTLTAYTVALVAFAWIRESPE